MVSGMLVSQLLRAQYQTIQSASIVVVGVAAVVVVVGVVVVVVVVSLPVTTTQRCTRFFYKKNCIRTTSLDFRPIFPPILDGFQIGFRLIVDG